jgi:enoyl-CoA hydratase / long-chain 3-hydroxyacyl-CoA dehydrogenase
MLLRVASPRGGIARSRLNGIVRFNETKKFAMVSRNFCASSSDIPKPLDGRDYTYFDNFECKEGVAIIRLNGPAKMNTINMGMQKDAEHIFKNHIIGNNEVKAVVFISSKSDNFIAGADIDMIKNTPNKSDLKTITMQAHNFFDEIKSRNLPFVSAMNGAVMGGGLEWALYSDYRIITTNKKSILSLPEVKLGLLPGMAGTYHLPKLIGIKESLGMILQGKNVRPDKAKKLGLVDLVVDESVLEQVAIQQAKGLIDGSVKINAGIDKHKFSLDRFMFFPPLRNYVFDEAKKTVLKAAGDKYPAPLAIIELLRDNLGKSKSQHIDAESTLFAKLADTNESSALIGLFHGSTAVKKHNFGKPSNEIKTVAVLGAGLMGAGVAQVSLDNGRYNVLLKDSNSKGLGRGMKTIDDALQKKLKKKSMTNYDYSLKTSNLVGLHDGSTSWKKHFSKADIVIEAVFEELSVKHKVLAEMEEVLPSHAIFASNTSAIPIGDIAKGAKRPERVIGMHYFSPVPMMPLLEIISHSGTAPEVAAAAMEVGSRQGKTPIFVKDVPGFFVNRCLAPFMTEVTALVAEGCELQHLDKAMKNFGMPVGPITLCDEVGVDITQHVGSFMRAADLGVRMNGGSSEFTDTMVDNKWLGRKTGKGFFDYETKIAKGADRPLNSAMLTALKAELSKNGVTYGSSKTSEEDMQYRMIGRFINEAAWCLQDDIVRGPVDADIGSVFGIGFAPFTGGPFRFLDVIGTQQFVDRMNRYADQHGEQFRPAQILIDYGKSGKKFHS